MCKKTEFSKYGKCFYGLSEHNFPRTILLLSDQEKIPTRKMIYAHEQYFVVKSELLLPILRAYLQCSHYALLEMANVFSMCVLEQWVTSTKAVQ